MNKKPQQTLTQPLVDIAPLAIPQPALEGESPISRQRRTVPEIFCESMRLYFLPLTTVVRFALNLAGRPRPQKP